MLRIRHLIIASSVAAKGMLLCACDSAQTTPPKQVDTRAVSVQTHSQAQGMIGEDDYCGDTELPLSDKPLEAATPSGDYTVRILGLPQPLPANQIFILPVEVTPSAASGDQPIRIRVDAGMPHHGHGMVVDPAVSPQSEHAGRFEVRGMMLHMAGAWELYIDVFEGPYSERVTFHVRAQ